MLRTIRKDAAWKILAVAIVLFGIRGVVYAGETFGLLMPSLADFYLTLVMLLIIIQASILRILRYGGYRSK